MTTRLTNLPTPFAFQFNVDAAGTPEKLSVKIRAATIAFVASTASGKVAATITDSGSGFRVAGFQSGDHITVSGSVSNDGSYIVATVAAGTLTLQLQNTLIDEAAGATVKIIAPKDIPDGVALTIKAKHGNTGLIHFADCSERALNSATGGFTLNKDESVGLQVTKTTDVWLDVGTSSDGVECFFEKGREEAGA